MNPTNNDYLSDIAGLERRNGLNNNSLLRYIAENSGIGGLTQAQRELLASIPLKADLVDGKVPESQLPSYIDSVQEYPTIEGFPETGISNVIYVASETNAAYRWSGSTYVQIGSGVALGETEATAYRGDRGAAAYSHILSTNNPHMVTKAQVGLGNVDNTADSVKPVSAPQAAALLMKENLITPSTTINYYRGDKSWAELNKASVGLSNVDNTSDINKPISTATQSALTNKADLQNGRVVTSQLPSYVDNVQEYATLSAFPETGMSNVVYLSIDTNKPYRWGGSSYVEISSSGVALGETEATAYRGDRGKAAYDHSLLKNNPHEVTKAQLGLENVNNTSDANKPVSTATQTALDGKASTVHTHAISDVTGLQDALNLASNPIVTTVNGWRRSEYADRFEYVVKIAFSRTLSANQYLNFTTTTEFPDSLDFDTADEHYISINQTNVAVFGNVSSLNGFVRIGLRNDYNGTSVSVGSISIKLVRHK